MNADQGYKWGAYVAWAGATAILVMELVHVGMHLFGHHDGNHSSELFGLGRSIFWFFILSLIGVFLGTQASGTLAKRVAEAFVDMLPRWKGPE